MRLDIEVISIEKSVLTHMITQLVTDFQPEDLNYLTTEIDKKLDMLVNMKLAGIMKFTETVNLELDNG